MSYFVPCRCGKTNLSREHRSPVPTGVAVGPTPVPLPGDRGPDTARTTAHTAQPQGQGHGALVRSADEDTLTS